MINCNGGGISGALIILTIGVIFLLRNLGIIQTPSWSIIWPMILIILGLVGLLERCFRRKI
ncbi:MAG: DUF5668 domain-containing protein [bacterium]